MRLSPNFSPRPEIFFASFLSGASAVFLRGFFFIQKNPPVPDGQGDWFLVALVCLFHDEHGRNAAQYKAGTAAYYHQHGNNGMPALGMEAFLAYDFSHIDSSL